jgi:thiamine biosynthesis protein ThiS
MHLVINGEDKELSSLSNLASLVEQLGLQADRLAVELNRDIVPRARWSETELRDGDKLEIVHFVGGGSDRQIVVAGLNRHGFRGIFC